VNSVIATAGRDQQSGGRSPSMEVSTMRHAIRWSVGAITVIHGLIHLMGAVEGLGWTDIEALDEPIGPPMAGIWAGTALLVVVAGVSIMRRRPGWWPVAAVAAAVSQVVVITSWSDAAAGTAPNVLLAIAAAYGYRSHGRRSALARYSRATVEVLADAAPSAPIAETSSGAPVTEAELAHLPAPVAAWVRASGAVGRPHVGGFRARIRGRIRSGPDAPWMPFTGEQVNTFGRSPARLFLIDATMHGLPVDVLHEYVDGHAAMRVTLASTIPIADASGPELDRSETVTLLNDLCLFAPAALVDAPVRWSAVDDHRAIAEFTNAGHTVRAELVIGPTGAVVDFTSDDRFRASRDGTTFERQRWSTPIDEIAVDPASGRSHTVAGRGLWHPADGDGFDYLDIRVDDIEYFESSGARNSTWT
jgi:hypothetical protein